MSTQDGLVSVAEITQNLESYIGKSVLVRNDVIKIIDKRGMILDQDLIFGNDNLLVVNISKTPLLLDQERTQ